jgi:hypothetical protein
VRLERGVDHPHDSNLAKVHGMGMTLAAHATALLAVEP